MYHIKVICLAFAALSISACHVHSPPHSPPEPALDAVRDQTPVVTSVELDYSPNRGQSAAEQDRDRYECYRWAMKQSGYDPSLPPPPHEHVHVASTVPPGHDTLSGAVHGAIIGSMVTTPERSAKGAFFGALAGAIIGSASDAEREHQQERYEEAMNQPPSLSEQAMHYRRAMGSCLQGRGYTIHDEPPGEQPRENRP